MIILSDTLLFLIQLEKVDYWWKLVDNFGPQFKLNVRTSINYNLFLIRKKVLNINYYV